MTDGNGLLSRHILLDTSIYASAKMDLNSGLFRQLGEQVREFGLSIHFDDLIEFECGKRIRERAEEVVSAQRRAAKATSSWEFAFKTKGIPTAAELNVEALATAGKIAFMRTLQYIFKSQKNPYDGIKLEEVLRRYTNGDPPFHETGSKEFPDAVIIEAALRWCRKWDDRMYIVTGDKRMFAAAEFHPELIPLASLEDLLQLFVVERDPAILAEVLGFMDLSSFDHEIAEALDEDFKRKLEEGSISYEGDAHSGGAVDIDVLHLESIGPLKVIAFDDATVTCFTPIGVRFSVMAEVEWLSGPDENRHLTSDTFSVDESDYNRGYIVFDRTDGSVRSATVVADVQFADPRDW